MTARQWARTGSTPFVPSVRHLTAGGLSAVLERGQGLEHHGQRDDARRIYEQALRDGFHTAVAPYVAALPVRGDPGGVIDLDGAPAVLEFHAAGGAHGAGCQ